MKNYVWCSPHTPTEEQISSLREMGNLLFLNDFAPDINEQISNSPNTKEELYELAYLLFGAIETLSKQNDKYIQTIIVQPGGSPAFQYALGCLMCKLDNFYSVIYAHSERISSDILQDDGSIKKVSVFKHLGWV